MPTQPDFVYVENDAQTIVEVTDAPPGPKGDAGAKGDKGDKGDAGTIAVGTTSTVNYGNSAAVTNSGTPTSAVLNFTIPSGPTGPQGPAGTDGAAATYIWDQSTPSATWNIAHNLGYFPNVTVVDSGGNDVVGSVSYINEDNLVVKFSAAFGGKAYLS